MRTFLTLLFVVIWFLHLILGVGAGYAALRLWYLRRKPLIRQLGPYLLGFVVEVLTGIALIFVARGVKLTWKYSIVWFVGTLISDLLRAPLVLFLIKGHRELPAAAGEQVSGDMPPDFWRKEFREAVREEMQPVIERIERLERRVRDEGTTP